MRPPHWDQRQSRPPVIWTRRLVPAIHLSFRTDLIPLWSYRMIVGSCYLDVRWPLWRPKRRPTGDRALHGVSFDARRPPSPEPARCGPGTADTTGQQRSLHFMLARFTARLDKPQKPASRPPAS